MHIEAEFEKLHVYKKASWSTCWDDYLKVRVKYSVCETRHRTVYDTINPYLTNGFSHRYQLD